MGRRRKKIRKVQRTIPPIYKRFFVCPRCGALSLQVTLRKPEDKEKVGVKIAEVICGSCKLRCVMEVPEVMEKIDVYNRVADMVYSGDISKCLEEIGAAESEGGGVEAEDSELPAGEEG